MFNERNFYLDRCIIPTMALNGMEGASKTIKIMWQIKRFNHKKSLIRNFLGTWYFQFAVFQNQFAIVDFRSLNANAVLKKKLRKLHKIFSSIYMSWKVMKQQFNEEAGYFVWCNVKRKLCYLYAINTKSFTGYQANKNLKLFWEQNCKSTKILYFIKSNWCKIQYVAKEGTPFNVQLNNQRNTMKSP